MTTGPWRYFWSLFREKRAWIAIALVVSLVQAALFLPIAWLVRRSFDVDIPSGNLVALAVTGAAILAAYLTSDGLRLFVSHIILDATKKVIQHLQGVVIEKVYRMPRWQYGEADLAKMHARIVQDTLQLDIMSNSILSRLLPGAASGLCLAAVLLWLSWPLFLAILCLVPIFVLASRTIGSRVRARMAAYRDATENFSKSVLFALQMLELTKIQSAENAQIARHATQMNNLRITSQSMAWLVTAYSLLQGEIAAWSNILLLTVGGTLVATHELTIGRLIGFYFFLGLLRGYVNVFTADMPQVFAGEQALRSLWQFLRLGEGDRYRGTEPIAFRGEIEVRSVSFDYGRGPLIQNLTMTIAPGSIIALIGPSGAGKTTVVNLILGLEAPKAGRLYADGRNYDDLDIADLRRQIAVVLQDPWLFAGTIRENLVYGTSGVSDRNLARALALAGAESFIAELPDGYDTWLGERGTVLSGGQRQRLAIARALLRDAPLMILDEPTHHLGAQSVRAMLERVTAAMPNIAILIITHDRELLGLVDRCYSLEYGHADLDEQMPVEAAAATVPAQGNIE